MRYSAPEQLRNQYDGRGDVYSLGATLYELLARRPPFAAADRGELVRQIAEAEPAPLRDVPRNLDTVVRKAMAKDPAKRYESAAALVADLRRYLAGEPVRARPVSAFERTARWAKRHPAIAGLSAAVATLLVAVAGVSIVGYVRTSNALETAEKAKIAESGERQRAERGEQDARQALAQTLLAINKAHAIVDAMPIGYISLVSEIRRKSGALSIRNYIEPGFVTMTRLVDLYEEFPLPIDRADGPSGTVASLAATGPTVRGNGSPFRVRSGV